LGLRQSETRDDAGHPAARRAVMDPENATLLSR